VLSVRNFTLFIMVKKICKSVKTWQSYIQI